MRPFSREDFSSGVAVLQQPAAFMLLMLCGVFKDHVQKLREDASQCYVQK